ncbi:hypothetical protein OHA_1_00904 [Pleomorphomonas sp. SM30]|uniref:Putative membrane protein DUF2207 n=1 Tax=Oharaeibacter diazotrophicus TaxID=1920512 RepID=A0A4R6RLU8_9HYPH|nr:putative membrane protein DUF2207 [Oharaeibacter diazotrophicus]BBE71331.1 hypothetical protein OHA_1_00904 [Pleomorphomonas sp. SM30]
MSQVYGWLAAVVGTALVSLYYLVVWWTVGRDPPAGAVKPEFVPPPDLSPSLARYILRRGITGDDLRGFTAAAVDLAVKGIVVVEEFPKEIRITRTAASVPADIGAGERAIAERLPRSTSFQLVDSSGHRPTMFGLGFLMNSDYRRFHTAVARDNHGRYFVSTGRFMLYGITASIIVFVMVAIIGPHNEIDLGSSIFITFCFIVGQWGLRYVIRIFLEAESIVDGIVLLFPMVYFSGLLCAVILGWNEAVGRVLSDPSKLPLPVPVGLLLAINGAFYFLKSAPTELGRQALDRLQGLKLYLSATEIERNSIAGAPAVTPRIYETLLPYAIALEVERPWSEALEAHLRATAGPAAADSYRPAWFPRSHRNSGSIAERIGVPLGDVYAAVFPPWGRWF